MPNLRLHFGPYKTPVYKYGKVVRDEIRGEVTIVGTLDSKIPWPVYQGPSCRLHVIYKDLARAVRQESNQAVAHWWGVTPQTVTKWRKALGVAANNKGTSATRRAEYKRNRKVHLAALDAGRSNPARAANIAKAKLGVSRPRHVIEAMRKGRLGLKHSEESRQKMSAAHKRRGTRPPAAGVPWSAKEDALLDKLPAAEVARRTKRTVSAVRSRRSQLGMNDGRTKRFRRAKDSDRLAL
jgi:hypothetical protein